MTGTFFLALVLLATMAWLVITMKFRLETLEVKGLNLRNFFNLLKPPVYQQHLYIMFCGYNLEVYSLCSIVITTVMIVLIMNVICKLKRPQINPLVMRLANDVDSLLRTQLTWSSTQTTMNSLSGQVSDNSLF